MLQSNEKTCMLDTHSTDFKSGMSTIPSRPQGTDKQGKNIIADVDFARPEQTKQSQDVGTVAQFPAQRVLLTPNCVLSPEFQAEKVSASFERASQKMFIGTNVGTEGARNV